MIQNFRFFLFLVLLLSNSSCIFAQRQNKKSMSEFGFMGGGMYYIGDLNSFQHFKNTNFSGGLLYRYNVHSRLSIRANVIAVTKELKKLLLQIEIYPFNQKFMK
jgi:hypothetical protein